jgi:methionine synthase II (cobalamin-independent)
MRIKPFSTTGIGSLPHRSPDEAVELVLRTFDIPFWPQLPALSFREQMIPQFSEGIPFIRINEERGVVWVERAATDELERFYEACKEESLISVSEDYARGFYAFLKAISKGRRFPLLKGHITGPMTFTLGIKDENGKALYYDEELREICLMALKSKLRWQIELLRPYAEGIIIFIDEPILSALGTTAYLGVMREEALRLLKEAVDAVKGRGALAGIHCCGRADWSLLIESGADIISFDAYDFGDTLSIYPEEVNGFLKGGGMLAWGIVPTTEAIGEENEESIKRVFYERLDGLSRYISRELLLKNILLTPSCGTGSRSIAETLKIFQLLIRLKEELIS